MSRAQPRRGNQTVPARSSHFVAPWRFEVGSGSSQHSKITRRCCSPQQHESVTLTRVSGERALGALSSRRRRTSGPMLRAVSASPTQDFVDKRGEQEARAQTDASKHAIKTNNPAYAAGSSLCISSSSWKPSFTVTSKLSHAFALGRGCLDEFTTRIAPDTCLRIFP